MFSLQRKGILGHAMTRSHHKDNKVSGEKPVKRRKRLYDSLLRGLELNSEIKGRMAASRA